MPPTVHSPSNDGSPNSTPRNYRGLIALNAALLVVLGMVTFGAHVHAQNRLRGDYTMVAGGVNGANGDVVYVVDVTSQEMFAVIYDENNKTLDGVGYRHLGTDAATLMRPAPSRSTK